MRKATYWHRQLTVLVIACALIYPAVAFAWEFSGRHEVRLHPRTGEPLVIGLVEFRPIENGFAFSVHLDRAKFKDYFLSMREFKCIEGDAEIQCQVPYPYRQPSVISPENFAWLEHSLLFFYKQPREFGAKLWNGIYYRLEKTPTGLVGRPQAVDLNQIGAPPADLDTPPFGPGDRSEIPDGIRWFGKITID